MSFPIHRARSNLKLIAMSGMFAGSSLEASKRFGAQGSIARPVRADALLDAVARMPVGS